MVKMILVVGGPGQMRSWRVIDVPPDVVDDGTQNEWLAEQSCVQDLDGMDNYELLTESEVQFRAEAFAQAARELRG
jgi:hypothetical protein